MIVVTGATGKLGRLVISELLKKVPAGQIVAAVRSPQKADDLKALGIVVRHADYTDPATLNAAFEGAEKILLISSSEVGQRVAQHKAVIDAAKLARVKLLAYTSILRANTSQLALAAEHIQTERLVQESGLGFVFLRNSWYMENHTAQIPSVLEHGVILGAAAEGRFASATRADYAQAAVAVLTQPGHENKIYELAGDQSYSLSEFAAEVARQSGKHAAYKNLSGPDYEKALIGFGLPAPFAHILADSDLGAAKGELDSTSRSLSTLIGRPTTSLVQAVAAALGS